MKKRTRFSLLSILQGLVDSMTISLTEVVKARTTVLKDLKERKNFTLIDLLLLKNLHDWTATNRTSRFFQ